MKRIEKFYPLAASSVWVRCLLDAGAKFIQLRIKDRDEAELRDEIRAAKKLCDAGGAQLVVNDHWQLALQENCDFVHLGQEDLENADLGALRSAKVKYGISTHSQEELARALACKPAYIALGPIFETKLKQMSWEPQGLEKIGEWKNLIGDLPLVAIGGITLDRAPLCLNAGADSVAVITDIVQAQDPEVRVADWIERLAA